MATRYESDMRLEPDGSLSNKRMELFVLLLADGVNNLHAWRLTSAKKDDTGRGGTYRYNCERNPGFKERLALLMDRKKELEAKGLWGEIQWKAEQMYATGRAMNDVTIAMKATEMLMRVAERTEPGLAKAKTTGDGAQSERGSPAVEQPLEPVENFTRRTLLEMPGSKTDLTN